MPATVTALPAIVTKLQPTYPIDGLFASMADDLAQATGLVAALLELYEMRQALRMAIQGGAISSDMHDGEWTILTLLGDLLEKAEVKREKAWRLSRAAR